MRLQQHCHSGAVHMVENSNGSTCVLRMVENPVAVCCTLAGMYSTVAAVLGWNAGWLRGWSPVQLPGCLAGRLVNWLLV